MKDTVINQYCTAQCNDKEYWRK